MATESPKGPAEPISAGLAPLYALVKAWRERAIGYIEMTATADSERDDHRFRGRADASFDGAAELEAALPDVATDLNFRIDTWLGQVSNEALKRQRVETGLDELQRLPWAPLGTLDRRRREILTRVAG